MTARRSKLGVLGLLLGVAVLYSSFLARSPVFLNNDEAVFAVQAHAIATTLHDDHGRLLPLYFQIFANVWYHPVIVYLMAAFFTVLPVTEWSVRLPTVFVALLDVALIVVLARQLFRSRGLALFAGALLALTPSHFIQGRLACDYLYPVPFVLASFILLTRHLERPSPRLLFAAGLLLGLGFYSYIAAVILMPIFLALSCATLAATRHDRLKGCATLAAGFLLGLVPLIVWLPSHPAAFFGAATRYHVNDQLRSGLLANLRMHAAVFMRFFDPLYLFVRDRGAVTSSTGRAGVFALSMAVLMPVGLWDIWRRRRSSAAWLFVAAAFVSAPIAATFVNEPYTTDRAMLLAPFGVLVATCGLERLWQSRRHGIRFAAACLLALVPLQFAYFYTDYMTGYRLRAGFWFNGNNRAAMEGLIADDPLATPHPVYLADNIPFVPFYWKLYVIKRHREDLLTHTVYFTWPGVGAAGVPGDSLILANTDATERSMLASGAFRELALIANPDGTTPFVRLTKIAKR